MAGQGKKTFSDGEVLSAADVNDYLMDQSVMRFADSSARTAAIGTPTEGMVTYLDDVNQIEIYDGTAWVDQQAPILSEGTAGQYLQSNGTAGSQWVNLEIADDIITTEGDLIVGDASGDPVRLPVGSADQVLTSDGTTVSFQDAGGGGGLSLTDGVSSQIITSTQSITLNSPHSVFLIAGGGAGSGTDQQGVSGAGGGSGFISSGLLDAGTYTATIGAGGAGSQGGAGGNGGTTSIGAISALGGNGASLGTQTVPANGGNGGSGGAGGLVAGNQNIANNSVSGFDGQDATPPTNGDLNGSVGTSSGDRQINKVFISRFLIPVAESGSRGLSEPGGAYAGGGAGGLQNPGVDGASATEFGGGGAGARGNRFSQETLAGGDGAPGVILLVEI